MSDMHIWRLLDGLRCHSNVLSAEARRRQRRWEDKTRFEVWFWDGSRGRGTFDTALLSLMDEIKLDSLYWR